MGAVNANLTSCAVCDVICFLQAGGHKSPKIHNQLECVYGNNIMSNSFVRAWCRKVRDRHTDMRDEGKHGKHSLSNDNLTQKVDQVLHKKCHSMISDEFPQISTASQFQVISRQ